ncbi:MAG: hypothetical protein IRZ03_14540 [Acidobacterium ailaaui]|nr:hypothetical protein [Pseudacidobacterium ailaaui]
MAANISDADAYIGSNVIVAEDWLDADTAQKQRILNVAQRILASKYPDYMIPDEAVYEYCAALATAYNDTNKLGRQGIAGFSITGVASFTFQQGALPDMYDLIPRAAIEIINADPANVDLPQLSAGRAVKWTVL